MKKRFWVVVVSGLLVLAGCIDVVTSDTQTSTPTSVAQVVIATSEPIPLSDTPIPASSGLPYQPLLDKFGIDFVYVPAGEFTMGSTEQQISSLHALCSQYPDNTCLRSSYDQETPSHTVSTGAYWIGKTEITNAQFRPFVDSGGYADPSWWTTTGWEFLSDNNITEPSCGTFTELNGDNQPVTCISWYEAIAYTRWLKAQTDLDVRLPTEAQWEKAARGTDGRIFPWGNELDGNRFNSCDSNCPNDWKDKNVSDGFLKTAPVGSFPTGASPYGALDMAGNVSEWTSTIHKEYPYEVDDGREEVDNRAEDSRVLRGGSWWVRPYGSHTANRPADPPFDRSSFLGFRVIVLVTAGN